MKKELVIVDCGKNTSTLLKDGTVHTFPHNKLFNEITSLPRGTRVVSEEAHLGTPRRGLSKAQPYTDEQLLTLYKECYKKGIDLRFFPQQSTFTARQYYRTKHNLTEEDFPKSDDNDPRAIHEFLTDKPKTSLSLPKDGFDVDLVREDGNKFKQSLNKHLNFARASEPKAYGYEDDGCRAWLNKNIEELAASLSPLAQEAFGLIDENRYKKTNKLNLNSIKMTQLYSIVATLVDYDGTPRTRESTQNIPGWKFVKRYVLSMTPFHRKGGVARSNLYHHGIKNWLKNQCAKEGVDVPAKGGRGVFTAEQDKFFVKCRINYCNAIREVFQSCRNILTSNQ